MYAPYGGYEIKLKKGNPMLLFTSIAPDSLFHTPQLSMLFYR